jgi:tetratricopeptide (TPR) repeat protein
MGYGEAKQYRNLMEEIVGDVFYSNVSYRAKIAIIRQLTEVFVRIIINYPKEDSFTLGDKKKVVPLIEEVDKRNKTENFLASVVNDLRTIGNAKTHTVDTKETHKEEYDQALGSLYRLMAYPFIDYFCKKGKFSDEADVGLFSILPPKIRLITLKKLSEIFPENIFIWHKLGLIILKNENIEKALEWVENNKFFFEKMLPEHPEFDFSLEYNNLRLPNMYLHLLEAITHVKKERDLQNYPIYETFEESVELYEKLPYNIKGKIILNQAPEMKNLLDFLFQGH